MSVSARDLNEFHPYTGQPEEIMLFKMSGGDGVTKPLYYDALGSKNYYAAKADGKAVGMYHFAGGGDPIIEAEWFLGAASPLEEDDVLALDWEIEHDNPVEWCRQFVTHIHDKTGVWPLLYIDTDRARRFVWGPVLENCGLWIADYRYSPDQDVPCGYSYVMHQYADTPDDMDMWFGTVEQFKAYGYHAPQAPTPAPAPEPVPTPQPEPTPVTAPVEQPQPTPVETPAPVEPTTTPQSPSLFDWISTLVGKVISFLKSFKKGN